MKRINVSSLSILLGILPALIVLIGTSLACQKGKKSAATSQIGNSQSVEQQDFSTWMNGRTCAVVAESHAVLLLDVVGLETQRVLSVPDTQRIVGAIILGESEYRIFYAAECEDTGTTKLWVCTPGRSAKPQQIAESRRCGSPTLSPDGRFVAWIQSWNHKSEGDLGKTESDERTLVVARLPEMTERSTFFGEFEIAGPGPAWLAMSVGARRVLLSQSSGKLCRLDLDTGETRDWGMGKFPVSIDGSDEFLFVRDDQLFIRRNGVEDRIASMKYLNPFYRQLCVDQRRNRVICQDWTRLGAGGLPKKLVPGLVSIDMATGKKSDMNVGFEGPFQLLE